LEAINNVAVSILAGQALSPEADIGNYPLLSVEIPSTWTTAGLSFQRSWDGGMTWNEVLTEGGTPLAVASVSPQALGCSIALDPTLLGGLIKIRSGSLASPVNQANAVTLKVLARRPC
jgi:hypothetical protein